MSCKSINDGIEKKLENEFSEFLIQKIIHAGNSLQFQYLPGLLSQVRFEIRDTFGTKPKLMKFLKAHPNIFKVDSKGIVTLANSVSFDNCDSIDTYDSNNTGNGKTLLPEIKNGQGIVTRIFPEFAIIKADKPIRTYVHFTPVEFGANKDSLFIDQEVSLELKTEVRFNAIYGHSDYEIKYRATKVWIESKPCIDTDDNSDFPEFKSNKQVKNILSTEGTANKLSPKIMDHVAKAESKTQCQSTEVIKKKKNSLQSFASSETSSNTHSKYNIPKKMLENQQGKICPYSHGAVIKFGKDFSELADGDSSAYFLYGSEVSDIKWEFTEGDDVKFDAVETKKPPGWKAVLVWVGEKPNHIVKYDNDENIDEINKYQNYNSSNVLAESSDSSIRHKAIKHSVFNNETKVRNKSNTVSKKLDIPLKEYRMNNLETSKTCSHHKVSLKKSKYRKARDKSYREYSSASNYKSTKNKSVSKVTKISNPIDKNCNSLYSSKEAISDINLSESCDTSSEENNELQNANPNFKKFLDDYGDVSKHGCIGFSEDEISSNSKNFDQTSNSPKNVMKKRASINKYKGISGEIFQLYCKAAIIKNSLLERDIDFVLNSFYLNGKSVEEEQVIDLKEILKIGDTVNFNCFEIIDDFGDIFQQVTMAWQGSKPTGIYEISPEEFIADQELSVTINNELHSERLSESEMLNKNFNEETSSAISDISDIDFHLDAKSFNDTLCNYPVESEKEVHEKMKDHSMSSDIHHKLLSEKIIQRLRSYDCISSDSEVNLNIASEIINLVQKESNVKGFSNTTVNEDMHMKAVPENLCCSCTKGSKLFSSKKICTKDAETQTVITGEVVALSIYTQN